ncbi:MAG: hypothetical protein AAGF10_06625 [Verrucomicrobiota bacterium]
MTFKARLKVFAVGFGIGMLLLYFILSRREAPAVQEAWPDTPEAVQRQAAAGVLLAYQERRVPMESKFIADSTVERLPSGEQFRQLLLQGKDSGQALLIEEFSSQQQGMLLVEKVRVLSPDQLIVTLQPGAASSGLSDAIDPAGYRLLRRGQSEEEIVVGIGEVDLAGYMEAVTMLLELKTWVAAVEPLVYLEDDTINTP